MVNSDVYIDIHSHKIINENAITVLNLFPEESLNVTPLMKSCFSVGIHPWYLRNQVNALKIIREKLALSQFIAVGECGLDVFADAPMALQEKCFREQVAMSETFEKPMIIHCVRAYNELIRIKKDMKPRQTWILHAFNGNYETALQCLRHQMILSFGDKMLYWKANSKLFTVPMSSLLLETDNSGKSIEEIYNGFAIRMEMKLPELRTALRNNFVTIFPFIGNE